MTAWGNLLSLYEFDNTLFDNMLIPNNIDKELLISEIMDQTAELGLVYYNFGYIKWKLGSWSSKRISIWNELESTLHYDYNPIHNYDRTEIFGRQSVTQRKFESEIENDTVGDQQNYKNGYNSEEQVKSDSGETSMQSKSSKNDTDDTDFKDNSNMRAYGNIGVTTTQKMIQSQREVVQFDIIQYIIEDFKKEFCILVY